MIFTANFISAGIGGIAVAFQVIERDGSIGVIMTASETEEELPRIIVGIEMVLMLNLIRKATKKQIIPVKVTVRHPFVEPIYEEFMGCRAEEGNEDGIFFLLHFCLDIRTSVLSSGRFPYGQGRELQNIKIR